jgi:myo-inositol-1(or 4)-monophosphatase
MTAVPNPVDYQEELRVALRAADASRSVLLNYFGNLSQVEEKFQAGLVSEADRISEEIILQEIRKTFPGHAILGEESGLSSSPQSKSEAKSRAKSMWMIDPLDGTTNYVHQFPIFCSSIGLQVDGEMVVAVVDAPALNQRFVAVKGQGRG